MRKILLTLLVALLSPGAVNAFALGQIELHSKLNEQLQARIPLHAVRAAELDGLKVGLADPDVFASAGMSRPHVLSELRFKVVSAANGQPYIDVSSRSGIKEPYLSFIVTVDGPQGQVMREYTVLLETAN